MSTHYNRLKDKKKIQYPHIRNSKYNGRQKYLIIIQRGIRAMVQRSWRGGLYVVADIMRVYKKLTCGKRNGQRKKHWEHKHIEGQCD